MGALDFRGKGERAVKGITLNTGSLTQLKIPVPAWAEQRRIATVLDRADAVKQKRRESLRLLDEFLRSAFLESFGDPATNKKGWDTRLLGNVICETQYGTAAPSNSRGTGLPVLRMNNIAASGAIDLTQLKWCDIKATDFDRYTVRRGDLLFNRTNSPELVGKTAVWNHDEAYAFAGYLVRIRFDQTRVLPDFVSGYLNSAYGKNMLFEKAKPSINMSNISPTELKRLPIMVPPLDLQKRYASLVTRTRLGAERVQAAIRTSELLFDSLVQRSFKR